MNNSLKERMSISVAISVIFFVLIIFGDYCKVAASNSDSGHHKSTTENQKIKIINIDGTTLGRKFDGIGAVSAGASSRLLIDYPEPYRSNILDYLFKPNFGAGFTYLKVEIGGDGNTTCGSEPSFARTRDEMTNPNYQRGYEYWLMREAQDRNKNIELDGLQWNLPGWFKDNKVWSQDNADYLVKFLNGATNEWNLNMTHIAGSRNERSFERDWIVNILKPTLDRNGFSHLKIVGPDGCLGDKSIYDSLLVDQELKKTICAVSDHYSISYMYNYSILDTSEISKAIKSEVPLWSGEDFSLGGQTWRDAKYLAKNIIKCYLDKKIVKFNVWCPISSMADNACFSNVGIMKAAEPWSGFYEVWPTIWVVGHFNQFAKPGWYFVESGCGTLSGDGYYATYKEPNDSGNYSIVILSGNKSQKLKINTLNLASKVLHIWKSDELNHFVKQKDVIPENGSFSVSLDADCLYSITTSSGQNKGNYSVPKRESFTTDYSDNFNSYPLNKAPLTAKYIWDNSGAFEIYQSPGESKCLRQMVNTDLIHWIPDECAQTFIAQGTEWEDGEISSKVIVEENAFNGIGYAGIIIRGSYDKNGQANIPLGYRLNVYYDGSWKLLTKTKTLAEGTCPIQIWHKLKLQCTQQNIKAYIDNKLVADVNDHTYNLGAAGYTSGWNHAKFDDLNVKYTPIDGVLVSAFVNGMASSSSDNNYTSTHRLFDMNSLSCWEALDSKMPQWVVADLGKKTNVVRCESFIAKRDKVQKYKIEYSNDNRNWKTFADNSNNTIVQNPCFIDKNDVWARYVRLTIIDSQGEVPAVYAFNVYGKAIVSRGSILSRIRNGGNLKIAAVGTSLTDKSWNKNQESLQNNPNTTQPLALIKTWQEASRQNIFSADQLTWLRNPANDFHLEKERQAWKLYPFRKYKFEHTKQLMQPGQPKLSEWTFENKDAEQPLNFTLTFMGKEGLVTNPWLELDGYFKLELTGTYEAGTSVVCDGKTLKHCSSKGSFKNDIPVQQAIPSLKSGKHTIKFDCLFAEEGELTNPFIIKTKSNPEIIKK